MRLFLFDLFMEVEVEFIMKSIDMKNKKEKRNKNGKETKEEMNE